jgi:hypothetical protein
VVGISGPTRHRALEFEMAVKLLRRRTLIREIDFDKIRRRCESLYTRVSWQPITMGDLEQLVMFDLLRGKLGSLDAAKFYQSWGAKEMLNYFRSQLWDKDYVRARVSVEDNLVMVTYRRASPRCQLGWMECEFDYDT